MYNEYLKDKGLEILDKEKLTMEDVYNAFDIAVKSLNGWEEVEREKLGN